MKPTYERLSWGWCASLLYKGRFYRGRGLDKRDARRALKHAIEKDHPKLEKKTNDQKAIPKELPDACP